MPVATIGPSDALPQSHCVLAIARGDRIRTFRIRVRVVRAGAAALALLTCWLMASSLYLVFHDDLVAALIAREAKTQYAYEDRIAALRGQVEHEASSKLVGQTKLDGRLNALVERAGALEARASLLAQIGSRTGLSAADHATVSTPLTAPASGGGIDNPTDGEPTGSVRPPLASGLAPGPGKPHPDVEGRALPDVPSTQEAADRASFAIRLAGVEERLERVDAAQFHDLAVLGGSARRKADALRAAIESAGLSPDRLVTRAKAAGLGGPYVPLDAAITRSSFGRALDAMQADLSAASGLVQVLPHIPFATPLRGTLEITSSFGARLDPFLGRPAMHTGVDFAEGYGTEVRATAAGRVVTAGPTGGYGTMIEIDHGHGLATRYAHLSAVDVAVGQVLEKGAVIGEVGATGRATGPHLHYETRIDGEAVDPLRFLNAGIRLAALDKAL